MFWGKQEGGVYYLERDIGEKGGSFMKSENRYTDAPKEIAESLARSIRVEDFLPTPEKISGGRYQTVISDLLDACTENHMRELVRR